MGSIIDRPMKNTFGRAAPPAAPALRVFHRILELGGRLGAALRRPPETATQHRARPARPAFAARRAPITTVPREP
ncbi:MAG: hypothetical protein KJ018_12435, partial [Burkholderiales bacterium]|nr:hypothetical protein [Burkholderiales bacterium]